MKNFSCCGGGGGGFVVFFSFQFQVHMYNSVKGKLKAFTLPLRQPRVRKLVSTHFSNNMELRFTVTKSYRMFGMFHKTVFSFETFPFHLLFLLLKRLKVLMDNREIFYTCITFDFPVIQNPKPIYLIRIECSTIYNMLVLSC